MIFFKMIAKSERISQDSLIMYALELNISQILREYLGRILGEYRQKLSEHLRQNDQVFQRMLGEQYKMAKSFSECLASSAK